MKGRAWIVARQYQCWATASHADSPGNRRRRLRDLRACRSTASDHFGTGTTLPKWSLTW